MPNPAFDPRYVLGLFPEMRLSNEDPLSHYENHYRDFAYDTHPLFSASHYLEQSGQTNSLEVSPLEHFLEIGWKCEYDPHPLFNLSFYKKNAGLGPSSDVNPLSHYLLTGAKENISPTPFFDPIFYRSHDPALCSLEIDPLIHFIIFGWKEGKDPHPEFKMAEYWRLYPQSRGSNPLIHYALNFSRDDESVGIFRQFSLSFEWNMKFRDCHPISAVHVEDKDVRMNLVVPSAEWHCWNETSIQMLILALDLADLTGGSLRVISREGRPSSDVMMEILKTIGRGLSTKISFHSDSSRELQGRTASKIEVSRSDRFLVGNRSLAVAALKTDRFGKVVCPAPNDDFMSAEDVDLDVFVNSEIDSGKLIRVDSIPGSMRNGGDARSGDEGDWFHDLWDWRVFVGRVGPSRSTFLLVCDGHAGKTARLCGLRAVNQLKRLGVLPEESWEVKLIGPDQVPTSFDDGSVATVFEPGNGFESMGLFLDADIVVFPGSVRQRIPWLIAGLKGGAKIFSLDENPLNCPLGSHFVQLHGSVGDWVKTMCSTIEGLDSNGEGDISLPEWNSPKRRRAVEGLINALDLD